MAEYKILWTDSAQTDLEAIVDFIAEEDPRNALRVLERLEKRAHALRRFPERGRVVSEMRTLDVFLYRELVERPWRMICRFDDKRVHVLAVLDSRRDLTSLLLERLARRRVAGIRWLRTTTTWQGLFLIIPCIPAIHGGNANGL